MKMSKRSKIVIYALLGLVALYFLAPFIYMLFSAFKTESEAIAYPPKLFPTEWHFENFINAWKSQPFGTYLWNSILVTVFTTLGQVLSCSLVAYGFARLRWFRQGRAANRRSALPRSRRVRPDRRSRHTWKR